MGGSIEPRVPGRRLSAVREALGQASANSLARPLRSGLGALAMAVAVSAVAVVITALDGVAAFARATAARTFGSDTFVLAQIASRGTISRRELEAKLARNPPIRRSDVRFLGRHAEQEVLYAPLVQSSVDVSAGSRKLEGVAATGTGAELAELRDLGIERGRFLSRLDERRAAFVAVIGHDVSTELFPGLDPIGRGVRIGGRRFEVVGVQGRLGNAAGSSLDRGVYVPISAYERVFGLPDTLQVFARARDTRRTSAAEGRARTSLRARRRLRPGAADNFDLLSPEAARGFVGALTERVGSAAAPLSAMALLAAIVVVANTSLVSVAERTREIGVRRALGATRRQVMLEVVAESTLVAVVGGAAAVLVVLGASVAASRWAALPVSLSPGTVAWSLFSAALAGVLAGLYPARRAARIDIIQAVRSE